MRRSRCACGPIGEPKNLANASSPTQTGRNRRNGSPKPRRGYHRAVTPEVVLWRNRCRDDRIEDAVMFGVGFGGAEVVYRAFTVCWLDGSCPRDAEVTTRHP